jgi:hypothetical protein
LPPWINRLRLQSIALSKAQMFLKAWSTPLSTV